MMTRTRSLAVSCAILVLLMSARGYAGGPLALVAPGVPFLWPNGGLNIPFNPDQGGLGPLTNAQAVAQTTAAFGIWQAIPSASTTHVNAGQLAFDVDETNFAPFLEPVAPDGLSAIVYDEDGAIFDLLFGPDSGVLGFAGPEWINPSTGAIVEGMAFMNGGALLGPGAFPVAEFLSVQVHEYGHYQNLAHSVVNGQIALGDNRGPTPFDTFPAVSLANRIETMYPFLFINGGQASPHADDIAIYSHLYPAPGFAASTGSMTGLILGPNGTSRITGVNVIARNVLNPYDDAVSAISSDFALTYEAGNPLVGRYTLRGLTPGASYAVYVDEILQGGFSTPPRTPLPGVEEFFNGALESNNATTDIPSVFTPVVSLAGITAGNINIVFNRVAPGPIDAGDDTITELFPLFPINFCGETYDSLFVNSNGSVSFGAGSDDFSETASEFLHGPPRIAGLWDDLDASSGGTVSYSETNTSFTVTFTDVPEFGTTNANSFSISLFKDRGHGRGRGHGNDGDRPFKLSYGGLAATDGLAGFSCGERVTSGFEREDDLSRLSSFRTIDASDRSALYEWFTAADNDLDHRRFEIDEPEGFRDEFEPNDSPIGRNHHHGPDCDDDNERGRGGDHLVRLPFNTANRYSEISPAGDDVDFYRFRAKAGDILVIETVPGRQTMDTLIGLFDGDGNLLTADDDSGVGLLSRLAVQLVADGTYAVGVTTFPDSGFTGAGEDSGRYVLQINKYRGTLLPVGDDSAVEVPMAFSFPFQGHNWNSVFVNGNGNLTFGAADADFSESVPELLAGAPRIAAMWDDLFAPNGLVIAEEKPGELQIHFASVPEFVAAGTNYFTVVLDRSGDVTMKYWATNRSDAITGITAGGGAADPGPTDLSDESRLSARRTSYEQFLGSFGSYGGVDLSFSELTFKRSPH